ncbi:MAG: hypothetical protein ACOH2H_26540 [Cypionkella sp.]
MSPDNDFVLTGPAALSCNDTAAIASAVLNRPVRHVLLDGADLALRFEAQGMPEAHAKTLASLDEAIAKGAEDRSTDCVRQLSGHAPAAYRDFADRVVGTWA